MKKSNIALIGFMGSGKTTIGRILSEKLNMKFYDMDSIIEKKAGMKIKKIFSKYGEDYFRFIEGSITSEISKKESSVISTGGGIIKKTINIKNLKKNGIVIYLKTDLSNVLKRIAGCKNRPLFNEANLNETIKLYNSRKNLYKKSADITIITGNRNINKIVDLIIKSLKRRKDWKSLK